MARELSSSIGAGSTAAIVWRLLDQLDRRNYVPDPGAVCSLLHPEPAIHWPSLVLGVVLGFLIFPLCEIILAYRVIVFRALWGRVGQQELQPQQLNRPLYRFLN